MHAALSSSSAIDLRPRRRAATALRIALVSPLFESVPPALYGGTERVVAYLADALVDLGHEVTLFASGDSRTRAMLQPGRATALRLDPSPLKSDLASHLAMLHDVRSRAAGFDVLHFHTDILHLPLFESLAPRPLTTLHGRRDMPDLPGVFRRWPAYPLVSISDDQRRPLPHANWVATVHHGLPLDLFPSPTGQPQGYVAFVGRIAPEKRPDRASRIARRAGRRLKIAAKVDPVDARYFHEIIEPMLAEPHVEFVGELAEPEKRELMAGADALLFPIDWPEPFGLVMIEAMACGTPVVAWRCGSVPEVVDHGVTGYVVDDEDDAVAACRRVSSLDRARVREAFERRFSAPIMAARYVELYARLATGETRTAMAGLQPVG
jgi:glycosyltransferase involved in cell wall biosynthesis